MNPLCLNAEGFSAVLLLILIDVDGYAVGNDYSACRASGYAEGTEGSGLYIRSKQMEDFTDITLPILKPSIVTDNCGLIAAIQVWAIAVMVLGFGKARFSRAIAFMLMGTGSGYQ